MIAIYTGIFLLLTWLYATVGIDSIAFVNIENNVVLENQSSPIFTADFFDGNINQWTKLFTILQQFRQNVPNLNFLEVGSFEGRATLWLLNHILTHNSSHITCVDTFEGSEEYYEEHKNGLFDRFKNNVSPFSSKVIVSRGLSSVQLKKLSLEMTQRYDFIYIDADHKAKSALEDAVLSFPLLDVMGVMVFDDYEWGNPDQSEHMKPKLGIDSFLKLYEGCIDIFLKSYQVGIQKLKDC